MILGASANINKTPEKRSSFTAIMVKEKLYENTPFFILSLVAGNTFSEFKCFITNNSIDLAKTMVNGW